MSDQPTVQRYCTFDVGGMTFGISVLRVQEVLRVQTKTRIPLVSPIISGLINLRGEIVTTIDLGRRLAMPDSDSGPRDMSLVVRTSEGLVCILIDDVSDVVDLDDHLIDDVPPTVDQVCRDVARGVFQLDGRLLMILDVDRMVDLGSTGQELRGAAA